ncbi:PH domain-containing protein [Streptomyces sp. NPDC052077]|uniref:PH domain-containing protein n=1 Tax=Streptomyces sp. NPDC052077 TaxID=3154757 RepID=UPI00343BD31E
MPESTPDTAPALPALPVTFQPGRTRAVLLGAAVAVLLTITAVAVLLPGLSTGERLSFVVTALLLDWVLWVLARPKVVAEESGVTVVNLMSRRRLEWAEIVQVTLRAGDPWVFLNLSDGTSLPALGIQPGIARERALADARALRALVESRSAADPGPSRG